ncbi:MarC family protein [Roseateles sp. BYS180W]|uniref:UPF0056 membrane protein n=1 Tax=Roseateles rivi TaxID=3299028 RepID=A0ABW7FQP8_9BURK
METLPQIAQSLLLVPLTLLPIINPVSAAPILLTSANGVDSVLKRLARQVAINACFVIVVSMLVGTYVLDLFGISLPIVRIAGGLLVASAGWSMLTGQDQDAVRSAVRDHSTPDLSEAEIVKRSFFPLTFPLTTGPGCIAACIALGAQFPRSPMLYVAGAGIAILGAAITSLVLYLVLRNAGRLLTLLGEIGTLVMMRIMAFILVCVGIQILWTGWVELNSITT